MRRKRFRDDHKWWPRTPTTGVFGRQNNYHSRKFNAWILLQNSHCMNERVKKRAAAEKPPHTNLELQVRRTAVNVKLWMSEWIIQRYLTDRSQLQIPDGDEQDWFSACLGTFSSAAEDTNDAMRCQYDLGWQVCVDLEGDSGGSSQTIISVLVWRLGSHHHGHRQFDQVCNMLSFDRKSATLALHQASWYWMKFQ